MRGEVAMIVWPLVGSMVQATSRLYRSSLGLKCAWTLPRYWFGVMVSWRIVTFCRDLLPPRVLPPPRLRMLIVEALVAFVLAPAVAAAVAGPCRPGRPG